TGPTAYQDDHVGQRQQAPEATPQLVAMQEGRIFREGDPEWEGAVAVRREAIPVRRPGQDRPVAVVGRDTNLVATRGPSKLELAYLNAANDLCRMVCEGTFPPAGPDEVHTGPRAGADGAGGARCDGAVPGAAAVSRGHGRGRAGARRRRDRGAQPGPPAAVQGRHDPGDPPPGEEQPADRGGAAAAAGAAGGVAGRADRAGGVGPPGRLDRDG